MQNTPPTTPKNRINRIMSQTQASTTPATKNIVLIGAPSSGKGTFAQLIAKKYQIPAISTGELIRDEIKSGSTIGKQVADIAASGGFVSDEIVLGLLQKRLQAPDVTNGGFILDGFPRTLVQAEALSKVTKIDIALELVLPNEVIIQAVTGRFSCSQCKQGYNLADINYQDTIIMKPLLPKVENVCDQCGVTPLVLEQRKDDTKEVICNRLQLYEENTVPILKLYTASNILVTHNIKNGKKDWPIVEALLEANLGK